MGAKSSYKWMCSVGPSPCDTCPSQERCADLNLACSDFALYSYEGILVEQNREPTRKQYQAIYRETA